jgi:SagB-type dehydrogenase family enzyme
MYPSAGARYPIETYICVKDTPELVPGLYHYNVKENALEFLLKDKNLVALKKCFVKDMLPKRTVMVIILSAMFNRNYTKYTERSYRYSLIECGHIGQNICLLSEKLGIDCCAIGGFIDDKINDYLDVEPSTEAVLYVFALGKI